jgi:hypothetical protein
VAGAINLLTKEDGVTNHQIREVGETNRIKEAGTTVRTKEDGAISHQTKVDGVINLTKAAGTITAGATNQTTDGD